MTKSEQETIDNSLAAINIDIIILSRYKKKFFAIDFIDNKHKKSSNLKYLPSLSALRCCSIIVFSINRWRKSFLAIKFHRNLALEEEKRKVKKNFFNRLKINLNFFFISSIKWISMKILLQYWAWRWSK